MMIFAAIEKTAVKDGDMLYICRQKLRDALYATKGMKGLTGTSPAGRPVTAPTLASRSTSRRPTTSKSW